AMLQKAFRPLFPSPLVGEGARDTKYRGRMRGLSPRREPLTRLRFAKPPSPTRGEGEGAARGSRRHRDRREVHEPALRLYESPDLRAHRAGPDVVGDIQERGVVHG